MRNSQCTMPPLCILHCAFSIRAAERRGWWRQSDSNRRHSACKADALPTELCPRIFPARGAESGSVSFCARSSVLVCFFGRWGKQASFHRVSPGLAREPQVRAQNRRIDHRNSRLLGVRLLRKEVIQPQVPLRLPCYDFIPITTHTLGDSLPCGLGRRLRVQTAFMM